MSASEWTGLVVAIVLALTGAFDVLAYLTHGHDATVSAVVLDACKRHPILAFALGVLTGHLLWPQN